MTLLINITDYHKIETVHRCFTGKPKKFSNNATLYQGKVSKYYNLQPMVTMC